MDRDVWIRELLQQKIVVICRNIPLSQIEDTAVALFCGGIRFLEITFNQQESPVLTGQAIQKVRERLGQEIHVGAGTVFSKEQVDTAISAGAEFLLSPHVDRKLITYTKEKDCISIPGAFTPSEIAESWKAGADIVKLFPAGILGEGYVKTVRAPINQIPLMAVGGIHEGNMTSFMEAGVECFGIGSHITDAGIIRERKYLELEERAKAYIKQINK